MRTHRILLLAAILGAGALVTLAAGNRDRSAAAQVPPQWSLSLTGPATVQTGSSATYTLSANPGPGGAIGMVTATIAMPAFTVTSASGASPASRNAAAAATRSPSAPSAQPSPTRHSATCASGARSPLAPSEPYSGTYGVTPALSKSSSACATPGRTPE